MIIPKTQRRQLMISTAERTLLGGFVILLALVSSVYFVSSASAAGLTVTPITWNVIGLDSNNVNVGPNNFPVGARVCNTSGGTANNVVATFNWDTSNSFINLRSGSLNPINLGSLANNACRDAYFEVTVSRDANAYNQTRRYYISVAADPSLSGFTSKPREIFVEHLISQNRNSTNDVKLNGVSIPVGGSMSLLVGNSYEITLNGSTATQGYEQIESFINFPNTIFQVNAVTTTYSANAGTDSWAASKLYANGCNWENNPTSPNYRSCWGTGKYGGTVTVIYNVTIVGGAGTSSSLSTLIYDFSGSSYHYNSDFSTSTRIANIVSATDLKIAKSFVPSSILADGVTTSTLKLTIPNTMTVTMSGVNFTDNLPTGTPNLVVANPPNASTVGCGSPTFAPSAGSGSLSFSSGTLAPNSTCIIKVDVKASALGNATFNNTTGHLFINGTTPGTGTDTGNTSNTATLVASNPVACTPGQTLAYWTVPTTTVAPPDNNGGGAPTFRASNVATATASSNLTQSINNTYGVTDTYSWNGYPFQTKNTTYYQFVVDTRHYSNVSMQFYVRNPGGGNGADTLYMGYFDGITFTPVLTDTNARTYSSFTPLTAYFTGTTSLSGATTFRITGSGSASNQNGNLMIDNIKFVGCTTGTYPPPTLSKAFGTSPIPVNSTSTLTFTLGNTQTGNEALTNVRITDTLPAGLEVANPTGASTTCSSAFNPAASATTITYNTNMLAGTTCTVSVNVKATRAGQFDNATEFISANESGANKTSTGYGTASLVAIAPPSITKSFAASPIFVGNTTTLTFTVSNPNASTTLTGVQFSDSLPSGVTVATSSSSQCSGTLNTTNPSTIALSGGSIAANNSCTFAVTVTGTSAGLKNNVTGNVTSTNGGTGNTASATLDVRTQTPNVSLLKQVGPTASGPWTTFITTTPSNNIYFRFTMENTGDTTLNNLAVNDISNPTLDVSGCNTPSLNMYTYTTCIAGPVVVTTTSMVTNTAYASASNPATSVTSSVSYAGSDPTAVKLSQFNARDTESENVLTLIIGSTTGVILSGLAFVILRKRRMVG